MNLKELNSFKLSDAVTFHDKLNPKLWNGTKLRPDVREQLLVIAQDFLQELGVHDLDVKDITISGSNAAYSYTKHSDLDLHILVDMGNLPVDEVYRELFTAKKTIYNDTHDIKIHTIPVELYVQDSRQPVVSLGEYSVMNDQWIKIPTKRRSDFDQTATKSKYEKLLSLIEIALKSKKYSKVKHIIDTIKRYRQAGLDKGGEFGPENLAYKMLRSQGYITKLYDLRDKLHSEKLSFETMYQNIDEEINHWYDSGVKDAQRDAKLYPDRVVKKLNPRTRLKTMQDKRARHPEEVEQYSLGYRSVKQGVEEEYNTMQFASEKTPPVSPYAGVKDNQYRGGISEAADMNFEEGDCPIFAIALHRLSKLPLMALVEYDEELGSTVLIHAYVKLDDRWRLDITGETDVDWMLQKYPNNGNAEEIEIGEKDLLELGYGKSKCPTLQQVLPHAKEVLQNINEASGYIPSEKEKNDPRFKTALTVDVHPDSIKKNAKAFYWNTSRAGIPPTAKPNGKV